MRSGSEMFAISLQFRTALSSRMPAQDLAIVSSYEFPPPAMELSRPSEVTDPSMIHSISSSMSSSWGVTKVQSSSGDVTGFWRTLVLAWSTFSNLAMAALALRSLSVNSTPSFSSAMAANNADSARSSTALTLASASSSSRRVLLEVDRVDDAPAVR